MASLAAAGTSINALSMQIATSKSASEATSQVATVFLPAANGGGSQQNVAPIAFAPQNQVVMTGYETILSGNGIDQNGDKLTYKWTLKQKPLGSAAIVGAILTEQNIKFTPDVSGSYIFGLIVNDGKVDSAEKITTGGFKHEVQL